MNSGAEKDDLEKVVVPDNWTNDRQVKRLKRDKSIQPD